MVMAIVKSIIFMLELNRVGFEKGDKPYHQTSFMATISRRIQDYLTSD